MSGRVGSRLPLRLAVMAAERTLAAAGVDSPRVDAELLAAHVVGRAARAAAAAPAGRPRARRPSRELVQRRAAREPLQHLLGTAALGPVTWPSARACSSPGRRPSCCCEWGLDAVAGRSRSRWWSTCAPAPGRSRWRSRASRPDAAVHAVEADPARIDLGPAATSTAHADGRWHTGHAARGGRALARPAGRPRGPGGPGAVQPALRARRHRRCRRRWPSWDPPDAVFGGPDGLEIIRAADRGRGRAAAPRRAAGDRARRHPRRGGARAAAPAPGAHRRRRSTATWPDARGSPPPDGSGLTRSTAP